MKNIESILKQYLNTQTVNYESLHGGMMNRSYLVTVDNDKQYILYIPGNDSVKVDRDIEKLCQIELSKVGLTSKNVFFETDTGIKMNEYIKGSSLDKVIDFDYKKVATLLKSMHHASFKTGVYYNPFKRLLEEYEPAAKEYVKDFDEGYEELKSLLLENRSFLEEQERTIAHNDFQRSNVIKGDDNNYYVIDFEFAADNDPIYDIAAFGNGAVVEGRLLLTNYFNCKETQDEIKRFYLWRIYLSLQWYLVAINKHFKGEGDIHKINFLEVAKHFLNNAKEAKEFMDKEIK